MKKTTEIKIKKNLKKHPAYHHAYWAAEISEIMHLCEVWDKIKAYGVPDELIDDIIYCGYSNGYASANFDHGENE